MIHWNDDPFRNMGNLRLLKICNVASSGSLESLSRKLRVLEWHEFHLESLPSSFQPDRLAENELVELKMPNSRIEQLWNERVRSLNSPLSISQFNIFYVLLFHSIPNLTYSSQMASLTQ